MSKLHAEIVVFEDHFLIKKDTALCVDMADFGTKTWVAPGVLEPLMVSGIKGRLEYDGHVSDGHKRQLEGSSTGRIWDDYPGEKIQC